MTKKRIGVIDAETDPFLVNRVPVPFIWGFYDGENYEDFDSTEKLVEVISEFDGIIYAHNGGKFDLHFLLEYIEPWEEIMIISGRIAKMKLGNAELRDSYNIIPAPLAAYQKDEIDYAIFEAHERNKPANRQKIRNYLRGDCIYLHELVMRFIDEYGLCLTQAGSSMKQWKKISPLPVPKTNQAFYEEYSPYYYGGRVQCFEKGIIEDEFSVFDINSAYPFAMLHMHPYSANSARVRGFQRGADFYRLTAVSAGAFPYRGWDGLVFPCDEIRREYFVTGWELAAALDTGTVRDIDYLESHTFCNHVSFESYIIGNYEKRKEAKAKGDAAGTLLYKLAMNSLYGKFAANPQEYKHYMVFPPEAFQHLQDYGWTPSGDFGPWLLGESPLDEAEQHFYCVATGASITGFVRAMLWRAICACDGVLYCDTDSIAVRKANDIMLGDELGQWKHEGDFDRAGIAGKKMYVFRGVKEEGKPREYKYASKGVRLSPAELWRVCAGETVKYENQAPTFSVHDEPKFIVRNVRMT